MKLVLLGLLILISTKGISQVDTGLHKDIFPNSDTLNKIFIYQIRNIDGNDYSIQNYEGEKMWLVILPSSQSSSDSSFLRRIDSIALANLGKVKTIVIPSFEDGFADDSSHTLINWYRSNLDSSVLISEPLYTHISSDTTQADIFRWLTHSYANGHYDIEVSGVGAMFFINEHGSLNGVFDDDSKWNNKALNMMLE